MKGPPLPFERSTPVVIRSIRLTLLSFVGSVLAYALVFTMVTTYGGGALRAGVVALLVSASALALALVQALRLKPSTKSTEAPSRRSPLSTDQIDSFWDLYAYVSDAAYVLIPVRELLQRAFESANLKPNARLLDVGCGTGAFEFFISQREHPPIIVEAIDGSSGMLHAAERKCKNLPWIRFSLVDVEEPLPFEDDSFDAVVVLNVMYTIQDLDAALSEFSRVLKPDGCLVISDPLPHYRIGPLIAEHFLRIGELRGIRSKVAAVLQTVWGLGTRGIVQWILNDLVIDSRESEGHYRSISIEGWKDILDAQRGHGLSPCVVTSEYADQAVFVSASKRCGASMPPAGPATPRANH